MLVICIGLQGTGLSLHCSKKGVPAASQFPHLQAFFIIQDPYANAYYLKWKEPSAHTKSERLIGRGGWVATRNYELVRVPA